jgi:hypothetical protein
MTPEALEHMPALVEETLYELKNSGIELKRKKSAEVSFISIIEDYANPKIADFTDMSKFI